MSSLATVKIVNPDGGYFIINADDFDSAKHTRFIEQESSESGAADSDATDEPTKPTRRRRIASQEN